MKLNSSHTSLLLATIVCICLTASCKSSSSTPILAAAPVSQELPASIGVIAVSGDGEVSLSWTAVSAATASYDVYRSLSATQKGSQIASVSAPGTAYVDSNVSNGTKYYYVIDARNGGGVIATSSQVSATPGAPAAQITVSGVVQYQDKIYGSGGFTGNEPYKPVRYAHVEVLSGTNALLQSGITDSRGFYSITTSPTTTAFVRVYAEVSLDGASSQAIIYNISGEIYTVRSNDLILSGSAQINIMIPTSSSAGGAFNVLDVFTNGLQLVHELSGSYPATVLNGYWQTSNPYGTYYCTGGSCPVGNGIYVWNDPSDDTDGYDDDVLYHEFGHFVTDQFSQDDSPGGYHYLTNNDLDMRLTWSEGWGNFFPGAVKASLPTELLSTTQGLTSSTYVDTSDASWSIDMKSPPDASYQIGTFRYSTSEIAVSKILFGIRDSFGMQRIWDVITSAQFKARTPSVNIEALWDTWILSTPSDEAALRPIFAERHIEYSTESILDSTFTVGTIQPHTLYPAGDADILSFSTLTGSPYTVATSNLKNGADTLITLYDSDGLTITAGAISSNPDDNWNPVYTYSGLAVPHLAFPALCETVYGPCHENANDVLSSKIMFTAQNAGPYYVKIISSPAKPVSAGRYGTYRLAITQQ